MNVSTVEIATSPEDYRIHRLTCPACGFNDWLETSHTLWNVNAITCPHCHQLFGIKPRDYHGDDAEVEA